MALETDRTSIRVIIRGRVQGVFYRAWTAETAKELNLIGWVRNRHDGTVEAIFQGPEEKVQEMIKACWQGPPLSDVVNVESFSEKTQNHKGFNVLETS